jgi:hypothetical protein
VLPYFHFAKKKNARRIADEKIKSESVRRVADFFCAAFSEIQVAKRRQKGVRIRGFALCKQCLWISTNLILKKSLQGILSKFACWEVSQAL